MSGLKKQLRGHCHGQWRFLIRATWAVAQGSNIGQSFFSPPAVFSKNLCAVFYDNECPI